MTYSGWDRSRWHTFWKASPELPKLKQQFEVQFIDGVHESGHLKSHIFEFGRLSRNIAACVVEVKTALAGEVTPAESAELAGYMLRFVKDVEATYIQKAV